MKKILILGLILFLSLTFKLSALDLKLSNFNFGIDSCSFIPRYSAIVNNQDIYVVGSLSHKFKKRNYGFICKISNEMKFDKIYIDSSSTQLINIFFDGDNVVTDANNKAKDYKTFDTLRRITFSNELVKIKTDSSFNNKSLNIYKFLFKQNDTSVFATKDNLITYFSFFDKNLNNYKIVPMLSKDSSDELLSLFFANNEFNCFKGANNLYFSNYKIDILKKIPIEWDYRGMIVLKNKNYLIYGFDGESSPILVEFDSNLKEINRVKLSCELDYFTAYEYGDYYCITGSKTAVTGDPVKSMKLLIYNKLNTDTKLFTTEYLPPLTGNLKFDFSDLQKFNNKYFAIGNKGDSLIISKLEETNGINYLENNKLISLNYIQNGTVLLMNNSDCNQSVTINIYSVLGDLIYKIKDIDIRANDRYSYDLKLNSGIYYATINFGNTKQNSVFIVNN